MKKWWVLIVLFMLLITLSSCSFAVDEKAIDSVTVRITADELDSAISALKKMDDRTLVAGKSEILNAIIRGLTPYLNFNSWIATDFDFVDESVIRDLEKYKIIVSMLSLTDDESNVDDFIDKALQLKIFSKWNEWHATGSAYDLEEIKNLMDQGAMYKNNYAIGSKYYQRAYNKCMEAYNKFDGKSGYGMQETADFYYYYGVLTKAIIDNTDISDAQGGKYDASASAFIKIQEEHLADYDEVIRICDSFPKQLY